MNISRTFSNINISLAALVLGLALTPAQSKAASILLDGTFENPIGTGLTLTPWSDFTNAGVTRHSAPSGIAGNYASLPTGTDLFQRINPIPNGTYEISFYYQNASSLPAHLVFAVQGAGGSSVQTEFALGFADSMPVAPSTSFSLEKFKFTVDNPPYSVNEFFFGNSFNAPVYELSDSVNPIGTVINVADVSISTYAPVASVPEPSTWVLLVFGFGAIGFFGYRKAEVARGALTWANNGSVS